ncbi:MAG: TlpA family protein disulfide reductase [Phycisphaerales bacterium]|nr:TlpA family protein disulfide reductase [Phycisphaerales bacterium]
MKSRILKICLVAAAFSGGLAAESLAQGPAPTPGVKLKQRETKKEKDEPKSAGPKVGDKAIDWSLKDADGKTVKLADLKGKVVVMDFWATWCGPCRKAMPDMQKLHNDFKGKDVVVYGLNTWERDEMKTDPKTNKKVLVKSAADKAKDYMNEQKFTYGLLLGADNLATQHGLSGIPAFYIIDAKGKIVFAESGYGPNHYKDMKSVIQKALDEAAKDAPKDTKKPADAKPADTKPTDSKPAEKTKPTTEKPADPAKKG